MGWVSPLATVPSARVCSMTARRPERAGLPRRAAQIEEAASAATAAMARGAPNCLSAIALADLIRRAADTKAAALGAPLRDHSTGPLRCPRPSSA